MKVSKRLATKIIRQDAQPLNDLLNIEMCIGFSAGKLKVENLPQPSSMKPDELIALITDAVQRADLRQSESAQLSSGFFDDTSVNKSRLTKGIVETPEYVAEFMTKYSRDYNLVIA